MKTDIETITGLLLETLPRLMHLLMKGFNPSQIILDLNDTHIRTIYFTAVHPHTTMTEISRLVGIEKGPFTRVVDKLTEKGIVCKIRSAADRRKIFLQLTPKGKRIGSSIKKAIFKHLSGKVSVLTESEQKKMLKAFLSLDEVLNSFKAADT